MDEDMPLDLIRIVGHRGDVLSVDIFSNLIATGCADKLVRVFRVRNTRYSEIPNSPKSAHRTGVDCVKFSPTGQYLASCAGPLVYMYRMVDLEIIRQYSHVDNAWIRVICFSPKHTLLVTAGEGAQIKVWNFKTFGSVSLNARGASIFCMAFTSNCGVIVIGDLDGTLMSWTVYMPTGLPSHVVLDAHELGVTGCDIRRRDSRDDEDVTDVMATCSVDGTVKTWVLKGPVIHPQRTLNSHENSIYDCCFALPTLILSARSDGALFMWNQGTGSIVTTYSPGQTSILCCAAKGTLLASGSNDNSLVVARLNINCSGDKEIDTWTKDEVSDWLKIITSPEHAELFFTHNVDGHKLLSMTCEDFRGIGILDEELRTAIMSHVRLKIRDGNPLPFQMERPPSEFKCPITIQIMKEPVIIADGYSYEKAAITEWLKTEVTSPLTGKLLAHRQVTPNQNLQTLIRAYESS